jgi:putative ABC transport system ATP-binding protein
MGMAIELRGVTKRFCGAAGEPQTVIAQLSLDCAAGDAMVLEGPSGSGKSTLLNLIAGLHQPDEGEVWVGGTRLDKLRETARDRFRARHVGYVFQTFNLLSPLSALENLYLPAALAGTAPATAKAKAKAILLELGLEAHLAKRPYQLSVGQRQRVAVARALFQGPSLLLADEPTASLDPEAAAAVVAAILRLHEQGTTVVVASHDPSIKTALGAKVVRVGVARVGDKPAAAQEQP